MHITIETPSKTIISDLIKDMNKTEVFAVIKKILNENTGSLRLNVGGNRKFVPVNVLSQSIITVMLDDEE